MSNDKLKDKYSSIERVLIVGHGSIGKRHLRIARTFLPNADIRVLRRDDINSLPEYSNGCFTSLEHAIEFSPQIAVIANPATFHMQVAIPLAQSGVNLLVEKPISANMDSVSDLIATVASNGKVLMTGYNLRFSASLKYFKVLLDQKTVGEVLSVRCEAGQFLPTWRQGTDYRSGVSAQKALGGGALLELSHEIDYLSWIFGDISWVKASLSRQGTLDIDVEDTATLIAGFATCNSSKQLIAVLTVDFIRQDPTRTCVAIGESGTIRWNGIEDLVEIYRPEAAKWEVLYKRGAERDQTYFLEWENFLDCVAYGAECSVTGEAGSKVIEVIEAARKSSEGKAQLVLEKLKC